MSRDQSIRTALHAAINKRHLSICRAPLLRLRTRGCALLGTQDVSGLPEEEYRPPSPKYDERNFFMSTQNPWVVARPAASPGKRSPAVPRSAAYATPPLFALADVGGAAKRPRLEDGTASKMAHHAQTEQQVQAAGNAAPQGDANAAVQVDGPSREALQGIQAAPVPPTNQPVLDEPGDSALLAQRRARYESQVRLPARLPAPVAPAPHSGMCDGRKHVELRCRHSPSEHVEQPCEHMLICRLAGLFCRYRRRPRRWAPAARRLSARRASSTRSPARASS